MVPTLLSGMSSHSPSSGPKLRQGYPGNSPHLHPALIIVMFLFKNFTSSETVGHFYIQIDQDDGCTLCNDQGNLDTALCCVDILPVGILSLSGPARERCCSAEADH